VSLFGVRSSFFLIWFIRSSIELGTAVSTRVSNSLGSSDAVQARLACHTAIGEAHVIIGFYLFLLLLFRRHVASIFTDDALVISEVTRCAPLFAISVWFDGSQGVCSGVLRGMGRQYIGVIINCIGFYAISLPLALIFAKHMGDHVASAMWGGLDVGLAVVSLSFLFILGWKTNWQKECELAVERTGVEEESPLFYGIVHKSTTHVPGQGKHDDDNDDDDDDDDVDADVMGNIDIGTIHPVQPKAGYVAHFARTGAPDHHKPINGHARDDQETGNLPQSSWTDQSYQNP